MRQTGFRPAFLTFAAFLATTLAASLAAVAAAGAADLTVRVSAGPKTLESRVALRSLETWETVSVTAGRDGVATFSGLAPGLYTATAPYYDTNRFIRRVIVVPQSDGTPVELAISPDSPNPAFTINPGSFAKLVLKNAERGDTAAVPGGIAELQREQTLWKANTAELMAVFKARVEALAAELPGAERDALDKALTAARTRRGRIEAIKARVASVGEDSPDGKMLRRILLLHEARASFATALKETRRALEDLEEQLAE